MKTTLLIMAVGIGSRYGDGVKQLATVDTFGHIIMDYSIHDAIEAAFNKIVFIFRKDIETAFTKIIGGRIESICRNLSVEVKYSFQALDAVPEGVTIPEDCEKPWGTGQSVLAAKEIIHEPFADINADDYYGKDSFVKIHDFLISEAKANSLCMTGFILKNTLSDNGSVTRGIYKVDNKGYLTDIVETQNINKLMEGDVVKASIGDTPVDPESYVSMNMWGVNTRVYPGS